MSLFKIEEMRSAPFYFGITRGICSMCGKDSLELESGLEGREFKERMFRLKFISKGYNPKDFEKRSSGF